MPKRKIHTCENNRGPKISMLAQRPFFSNYSTFSIVFRGAVEKPQIPLMLNVYLRTLHDNRHTEKINGSYKPFCLGLFRTCEMGVLWSSVAWRVQIDAFRQIATIDVTIDRKTQKLISLRILTTFRLLIFLEMSGVGK